MSDEQTKLGLDVYLALAAVGWADGHLDPDEADAVVKAALEEGLELKEIEAIEAATKEPTTLGQLDLTGLTRSDRLYIYGVGSWMTRLDQEITADETAMLGQIASQLGLDETERADTDIAVAKIAYLSEDERPFGYDLKALRNLLAEE